MERVQIPELIEINEDILAMHSLSETQVMYGCRARNNGIGVLVAQLGTPDEATVPALRRFLSEFLLDPRVIEVNPLLWKIILHGVVLRTRPPKSAQAYKRIWTEKGSPLLNISQNQARGLKEELSKRGMDLAVELGMRYGSGSIPQAMEKLLDSGCSKIAVLPMYPQYSSSTTGSICDALFDFLKTRRCVPSLRIIEPYFRHSSYVKPLAKIISKGILDAPLKPEKLLLSYHGLPRSYIEKGDVYCCQCTETTRCLSFQIKFPVKDIIQSYQSRFGKKPWLQPYTDEVVMKLARSGIKHLAIACPGFTADCLETLDEVGNELKGEFKKHGGEILTLIPCLNEDPDWILGMADMIEEEISSWIQREESLLCYENKTICPSGF